MTRAKGAKVGGWATRQARRVSAAVLIAAFALMSRAAHAGPSDAELARRFAWLALLPLGLVQVAIALVAWRQLGVAFVGRTSLAIAGALGVGVVSSGLVERSENLILLTSILCVVPSVPGTVALLRAKRGPTVPLLLVGISLAAALMIANAR